MKKQISVPKPKINCHLDKIAIFGSADISESHPVYQEAAAAAAALAKRGKVIVNGGGPGVMNAATQGAKSVGGQTIAVTFYPQDMPEFEGRYNLNVVDKEIKTADYIERMFGLLDVADGYVCFQGGTGTLSEWSTAWLLAHLYYGNHKPLILYGDWWRDVVKTIAKHFFIGDKERRVYKIVANQNELLQAIDEFEEELRQRCSQGAI